MLEEKKMREIADAVERYKSTGELDPSVLSFILKTMGDLYNELNTYREKYLSVGLSILDLNKRVTALENSKSSSTSNTKNFLDTFIESLYKRVFMKDFSIDDLKEVLEEDLKGDED